MSTKFTDQFCWCDFENSTAVSDTEKYQSVVDWSCRARGKNPNAFDMLTEWILSDSEWSEDKLSENERLLMENIIGRFKEQNANLRSYLRELEPSGIINEAVFSALDRFDDELSGRPGDKRLTDIVSSVLADFSLMKERKIREQIAGNKTGATGTDSVNIFGYVNYLKDCDAGVQWTLFMPQMVENQQKGFKVASFEYRKLPAMRFIGKECIEHDPADMSFELEIMKTLDSLAEYKSELNFDVLFQHHYGKGVDVEHWHGFWGRFMKSCTPVPDGFVAFDFIPERDSNNFVAGPPYLAQFAFAEFKGDNDAIHKVEGFDSDAMYDVTRNIILGQNVNIPYPDKYWTAEVFLNGCDKSSSAYMFSVER